MQSLVLTLWVSMAGGPPSDVVRVRFEVIVPGDTPREASVYLAGSDPALGSWSASGLKLTRGEDGVFRGEAALRRGTAVEYKATLGTWERVEKNRDGGEIANRTLTVRKPATVRFTVERWAAGRGRGTNSTLSGDVRLHRRFRSESLGNTRTILVYVPPGYEQDTASRYSVLYMHDGQNVFDAATSFLGIEWGADESAERLIETGRIRPLIIVAIYNTRERMDEYTPWRDDRRKGGGRGEAYARFLVKEVKPFIDREYRTKPGRKSTAVAGSSLGGLMSLYLAMEYPQTIGKCGVISPALWWNDRRILKEAEAKRESLRETRFWVDMGTAEGRQLSEFGDALSETRRLVKLFDEIGLKSGRDYRYVEVENGEHNEAAWAARFPELLEFFYGR